MSEKNIDTLASRIKTEAEPGVMEVIEWAKAVHTDTMERVRRNEPMDLLTPTKYSSYEREEARKILLEYGVGKPTRVIEHKGSQKHKFTFETKVIPSGSAKQLEAPVIDAEMVEINETVDS